MELNKILKRPIIWYLLLIITTLVIMCFLLISKDTLPFIYGLLIGSSINGLFLLIDLIYEKYITFNLKSSMYFGVFVQFSIKIIIFTITLVTIIITNNNDNNWEIINYPISAFIIIINYLFYSIFNTLDRLYKTRNY